jgi:xanthine dehydrogenase YagS FAD-binding subunit
MRPFVFSEMPAKDGRSQVKFLAGGTTLVDLMKLDVETPEQVVDLNRAEKDLGKITASEKGLRFGAMVRMAEAAKHEEVRKNYPVIAQSLELAASQQVRNMASLGGNVLQRTRCSYFRDVSYAACNKRDPGSGCSALEGVNRAHAVLGTSEACISAYPGDFAQALMALDAEVETDRRTFKFAELHRPSDEPHVETILEPGELIRFITVPSGNFRRSLYLKIRDRDSYQFALTSAAVAIDLDGDTVKDARIALGGVAYRPWRAREAEEQLNGKALDEQLAASAADAAFENAKGYKHNAFKIETGKQTLIRALLEAKALEI